VLGECVMFGHPDSGVGGVGDLVVGDLGARVILLLLCLGGVGPCG